MSQLNQHFFWEGFLNSIAVTLQERHIICFELHCCFIQKCRIDVNTQYSARSIEELHLVRQPHSHPTCVSAQLDNRLRLNVPKKLVVDDALNGLLISLHPRYSVHHRPSFWTLCASVGQSLRSSRSEMR